MADSSEEDDYLSMVIAEPNSHTPETSFQRRKRLQREGEERSRIKSKADREAEAESRRNEALSTSLDASSKGSQLLAKLGYKPGQRLGAAGNPYALAEPIGLETKDDRGGIGMDSEKKRKVREAAEQLEHQAKRAKADENDFRERAAKEREEKRMEGQWWGAMRVAEKFDTETPAESNAAVEQKSTINNAPNHTMHETSRRATASSSEPEAPSSIASENAPARPLPNLLWRAVPRHQAEKEQERRMRFDLEQSLPRNLARIDPEEDEHDRRALGKEEIDLDLQQDDPELEAYLSEPVVDRLEKVVHYLREKYYYCFWCKYQYHTSSMEGCPGETEEDHD